jgi:hypothetical protein
VLAESRNQNWLGEGTSNSSILTPPELELMRIYHAVINEVLHPKSCPGKPTQITFTSHKSAPGKVH